MAVLVEIPAIERAHDFLGLTYRQLATALGADESTLHRWRAGDNEPSPAFVTRLEALDDLVRELERTFRTNDAARDWMNRPSPVLGERRPIDLLIDGRVERLTGTLLALNSGMTL